MSRPDLVVCKRISPRTFVGLHLEAALIAIAIWVGGFVARAHVPWYVYVPVGFVPIVFSLIRGWTIRASTEYRIYQDSLEVESGVVGRNIDNIQLFRVRDLGLQQSVFGRMLNVGNITVASTDESTPFLVLRGVDDPRGLYETLRGLVAQSQAARRTMIVEEEPHLPST